MTRAELASLICNMKEISELSPSIQKLSKVSFKDIEGRWYKDKVSYLAALDILNGYQDGTFRGNDNVTRAEVASVINKVLGRTPEKDIPSDYSKKVTESFSDVSPNNWFFKDVAEATIEHPSKQY